MANEKVFMSHSHVDRDVAVDLNRVILKYGGQVFLDQERIEVGDPLPSRLKDGIRWCNRFLLLWSGPASQSKWVREEYDYAYEQKKKIIPYVLDGTPLPDPLENFVYVKSDDRNFAHANLLSAIFGKTFQPLDPTEMFPGLWSARIAMPLLGEVIYDVELRKNGQLVGNASLGQSEMMGEIARQYGFWQLLNAKGSLRGQWSYEDVSRILTLDITCDAFGTSNREVIKIVTTGKERHAIQGQDLSGRFWIVERKPEELSFRVEH